MKCYYEELGVERDANDADIKSAYRKLALRWHPDKNPDCMEEAKQQFVLIQQAYEVLSDPQERAFYDNHREQILRGKNSSYEDNCLNVFEYFTITCFKGFGDDENGFYAVYREVFDKIAAEDAEFMDDEADVENIPSFGNSQSDYVTVVGAFYAYWTAYCTKKTYTWLCPYDIKEAKDRRIIRAIDKEMKKVVQKARKERNEEVRSLVAFVRKRDKRVQEYNRQLEERATLNRQKQEQKRLEQVRKRQEELQELAKHSKKTALDDGYEARLKELEQQYADSSSEYEDEDDEFKGYVVVAADASYADELDNVEENEEEQEEHEEQGNDDLDNLFCTACNKSYKHKRAFVSHLSSKKHEDNVERLRLLENKVENAVSIECVEENLEQLLQNLTNVEMEELEELVAPNKQKKKSKKSKSKQNYELEENLEEEEDVPTAKESVEEEWHDKKTAKKKKNKKANDNSITNKQTDESTTTKSKKPAAMEEVEVEDIHACATCHKQFDSKNKLFTHLKSTNHSIYLPNKGKALFDAEIANKKGKGRRK